MTPVAGPTILVVGATGFIGAAVVARLRTEGFRVRAGARRTAPGVDFMPCDLGQSDKIREAVTGADLVIHAAFGAPASMAADTGRLLAAMSGAGLANLIYLSSIAVYGEATGRVDETRAAEGRLDAYARAKIASEAAVRAWTREPAHPARRALLLRPGAVYGAGSRFWIDKLAGRIRLGAWGEFGSQGEGPAPLIHVDDLSALIASAAAASLSPRREELASCLAANAVGPQTPSWNAYFRALAAKTSAPALTQWSGLEISLRPKLALGAKVWDRLGLPGARAAALAPTTGELALFARQAIYPTEAARAAFGFDPQIDLAEGLARTRIA